MTKSIIDCPEELWKHLRIFKLEHKNEYKTMNDLVLDALEQFMEANENGTRK